MTLNDAKAMFTYEIPTLEMNQAGRMLVEEINRLNGVCDGYKKAHIEAMVTISRLRIEMDGYAGALDDAYKTRKPI